MVLYKSGRLFDIYIHRTLYSKVCCYDYGYDL
jgi:hypothetical protein